MPFKDEVLNHKLLKNSFSISSANPKFSGNLKILIDDGLYYMESISANEELNRSTLKTFILDTTKPLRSNIKNFCNLIPNKTALYTLPDPNFGVVDEYVSQPSNLYRYGAISDTDKRVDSTHRFFAPLFIGDDGIPDGFSIFKVKRGTISGNTIALTDPNTLNVLTNENCELVKYYDLTDSSKIGLFLQEHVREIQEREMGISINFNDTVSVVGIDINSGVITERDAYINSDLMSEMTITESEAQITNSFERTNMIDPRFINLEFTFNLDLSNIDNNDNFVELVGFYVKNDPISENDLDPFNSIHIANSDTYIQVDSPVLLSEPLYNRVGSFRGASIGISKPPIGIIIFNGIPNINQRFSFEYGGTVEISLTISEDLRGVDIKSTIDLLSDKLTEEFRNNATNLVLKFSRFGNNELHVISTIASPILEGVKITEMPLVCHVLPPFIGSFSSTPNLIGTNKNTITLSSKSIASDIDAIEFSDGTIAVPLLGFRYLSNYAYQTNKDLSGKGLLDIKLLKERSVEYYRVNNLEHRKFDYNRDVSYHSDPLDFNLESYYNYLINKVNSQVFYGKLPQTSTPTELLLYKGELLSVINRYFDSIGILSREMLVEKINKSDFSFSTTESEYTPLQEYNELSLLENSLYEWVAKFAIRDGKDVTNAPQRFNTSMIFRYDSFTPSLNIPSRSLGQFTHSWYLIGSGTPPWYNQETIDGYTRNSVSESIILDKNINTYGNDIFEWSVIKTDPSSNITSTFFRGVRLIFPPDYNGYKFSSILISNTAPSGSDVELKVLKNSTFKTLTLVVNQFIPEPILTGLEVAGDYNLDRSLLYYSAGGNTTETSLASIGVEPISLLLFENTTDKFYNNVLVGSEWIYNDLGTNIAHIKLNTAINNFDLRTMLNVGSNLQIFYGDINPLSTTTFGIQIDFKNIVEVKSDYFWCTEIDVLIKENGILTPSIEVVGDYVADNTILFNDNRYATTESIARYNASFNRTISNNLNNDRYELISLGNISETMNSGAIIMLDDNLLEGVININTAFRNEIPLNQSLVYDYTSFSVSREAEVHQFSATRPSFFYDPITSVIVPQQKERIDISHKDYVWFRKASKSLDIINTSNKSRINQNIPILEKEVGSFNFDKYYSYSLNKNDISEVKWMYNPSEIKGYLSKVISVPSSLIIESQFNGGKIDINQTLKGYANKIMNKQGLLDYEFIKIDYSTAFRIYGISTDNMSDEEIRNVIVTSFIKNVLITVLRVESVEIDGINYDTTEERNNTIKILSLDSNLSGTCTVKFTHQ